MGGKCSCVANQSTDEAEDALLGGEHQRRDRSHNGEGTTGDGSNSTTGSRQANPRTVPRGPPPPYQQVNPFYLLTEEQRLHLMTRLTLIQSLPVGHYEGKKDKKKSFGLEVDEKQQPPLSPPPSSPTSSTEKEKDQLDLCDRPEKSESRECPICMNDFLQGDPIRLLPCMHYYHTRCIDEWLMRSTTCPNCMQRVDLAFQQTPSAHHHHHHAHHHHTHRRHRRRGSSSVVSSPPPTPVPPPPIGSVPPLPISSSSRNASRERLTTTPTHVVSISPPLLLSPSRLSS